MLRELAPSRADVGDEHHEGHRHGVRRGVDPQGPVLAEGVPGRWALFAVDN
ncbi:MAG: hypothetical protein JO148_08845 [Acidimicrobiia bacterium]|nr:hypothetical protein [Acidimicrobiia bacterium]